MGILLFRAIAVASITTVCLTNTASAAHPPAKAKKPAPVTKVKPATEVEINTPAPRTIVYIPTMASDGKGFVAQFAIDEGGDLKALKPPIVAAGTFPYSVTVDPTGKYCYAAQWTSPGTLDQFVIRPDGTLAANDVPQIPCGRQPYPITFTPDGKIAIVPNNAEGSISTYRVGADGKMTLASTLPTGKESRSIAIDSTGTFVYAANYDTSTISVFALAAGGELANISSVETDKLPYNVTLSPNGKYLYSANRGAEDVTIYSVNPTNGGLTLISGAPAGKGANWITFDTQFKYAYVTNYYDGTVSQFIVDATTGHLTKNGDDVKVGVEPVQVAVDPTDKYVYVANSGDNTVSQLHVRHDGSLSTGASVRLHGRDMQVGGTLHLTGSPWTIAFAKR